MRCIFFYLILVVGFLFSPSIKAQTNWVTNISHPVKKYSEGLSGHHLAIAQSHGRYYKSEKGQWMWQRPRLFCTTEDLFTQSVVVPYLIPMLEKAGAIVFTPRERDAQVCEAIVDNDIKSSGSFYIEQKSRKGNFSSPLVSGFATKRTVYQNGKNPFTEGTVRAFTTEKKSNRAFVQWVPNIPEEGGYAVYVSYQTLKNSVEDAHYYVYHKGGRSEFIVNQRIGGGTWVYLGTFAFDKGNNETGMVALSNQSRQRKGMVTADAVRFGGGMGNVVRGNSVSGLPRSLEGARYMAQWSGMPSFVYNNKQGENDYSDDINTRGLEIDYLSGGSEYNPSEKGLGVPIELSFSLHSDAGYKLNDELVGSLSICTTNYNQGKLASGSPRTLSRDFAQRLLDHIQIDIQNEFSVAWPKRDLWDKNYSETRLPAVPSSILEFLSHQNFADMELGHDPVFKFVVARSIYKSMLRQIAAQHHCRYVVQPLPVTHFSAQLDSKVKDHKGKVYLSWKPKQDLSEPSAKAKDYIVYTRIGQSGFDNGVKVSGTSCTLEIEEGLTYCFRVTAINDGGESFPSETLAAYLAPNETARALIVNGFDRLSGPAVISNSTQEGFDIDTDPGVPYLSTNSLCGRQTGFDRAKAGIEIEGGWGYSTNELEGKTLVGNSFDYPIIHGKALQTAGHISFSSCSKRAFEEGDIPLKHYTFIDLILGLQKQDPEMLRFRQADYRCFSSTLQQILSAYLSKGGNLLVSGSYIGSDLSTNFPDLAFAKRYLKCEYVNDKRNLLASTLEGMQRSFTIPRSIEATNMQLNHSLRDGAYPVLAPEQLNPTEGSFALFRYADQTSAGIAYKGPYRVIVLGFPFESIQQSSVRAQLMKGFVQFFSK